VIIVPAIGTALHADGLFSSYSYLNAGTTVQVVQDSGLKRPPARPSENLEQLSHRSVQDIVY
jgi:hypothetical protein